MKVFEAMVTNPITVMPNVLVYEAAKVMRDKKIDSVIVVDKGEVVGIATERDFVRRVLAESKDPKTVRVSEVMTSPVVSVCPNEDIIDAAQLMKTKGVRKLIVMEGKKLLGIMASDDLIRNIASYCEDLKTRNIVLLNLSRVRA